MTRTRTIIRGVVDLKYEDENDNNDVVRTRTGEM